MDPVFSNWIAGIGISIVLIYLWFWIKIARFYYSETIELASLPPNILTIIIPFRNEEKHLKKLVQHFENTPEVKSFPILFINDWNEVTPNMLRAKLPTIQQSNAPVQEIDINYWKKRINE